MEAPPHCESPVSGNSKHQTTPLGIRRKTSRKDQSTDVHTCSTPIRLRSENSCNVLDSPSDSFLCSQENRPDVVWDYTSPNLAKGGSKKKEIQITIEEFLKSLSNNQQAPQCNTQNSNYNKLLEKWMAKQNTPVCVKKPTSRIVKRDSKLRSRRVFEEIKQFMESIKNEKKEKDGESSRQENTDDSNLPKNENSIQLDTSLMNKKPLLEGESNENDSIEELWGETDNSFIVKATQHMDVSCSRYNAERNVDIVSTIPETAADTARQPGNPEVEQSVENSILNKALIDSDQAQIILSQIMNCDWDSGSDSEDLENGFIMGDEDLSLIPDEVLCGADNKINKKFEKIEHNSGSKKQDHVNISPTFSESDKTALQIDNMSEIELFNNFEDDSFGDESILCKPEVLSWIDEVENKLSQIEKATPEELEVKKEEVNPRDRNDTLSDKLSQSQRCTPDEIEKKKDEAIQRRRRNLSRNT